jgi:hypothetical protein
MRIARAHLTNSHGRGSRLVSEPVRQKRGSWALVRWALAFAAHIRPETESHCANEAQIVESVKTLIGGFSPKSLIPL